MNLPYLKETKRKTQRRIISFGGVNYGQDTKEGELEDCFGLSSKRFPCLSQRDGRKTAESYTAPSALYARGALCVVDGTDFLYDGKVVGQVEPGEKRFATINSKIVVFPDKAFYDTQTEAFGYLDEEVIIPTGEVTFTNNQLTIPNVYYGAKTDGGTMTSEAQSSYSYNCYDKISVDKLSGILLLGKSLGTLYPDELKAGYYWPCERNGKTGYAITEKVMSISDSNFQPTGRYMVVYQFWYVDQFDAGDPLRNFRDGDGVEISGCSTFEENNGNRIIRSVSGDSLIFDENAFQGTGQEMGEVTIRRKVPDLNCVCECDNRLWGAEGNTIYASALGDPTNFFVYDGLSTDSYAAAVGTDGEFTGCCAYGSTVLFFKENCVHKVLGSYPAQYQIYTYTIPGIQKGCGKSACIINETLFYKGRNGVYAYTGGTPELLTGCFGTRRFSDAVAGSDGQRYYISMKNEKGTFELYVFDPRRGIWLREDNTRAVDFACLDGSLYYLDGEGKKVMISGQDSSEEGRVEWSATLCRMEENTHGRKIYSRLLLRADMEAGSWLKVEVSHDAAPFRTVCVTHNDRKKAVVIPILPVRCDSFRIRLSGKGVCVIESLVREFAVCSEY